MNVPVNSELVKNVELYLGDVTCYDFSKLYCSIKGLESYLLILYRRLDIPQSYDLFERTYYAKKIIKYLHNMSFYFPFIKPFIYFLESYMRLLRGRKSTSQACMTRAEKYAIAQGTKWLSRGLNRTKGLGKWISLTTWRSIGWNSWQPRKVFYGKRSICSSRSLGPLYCTRIHIPGIIIDRSFDSCPAIIARKRKRITVK
ncbi:uncharacterized protein LOC100866235 [Apis florea]|uniref:uncharacterized protein LOC100866235 n=1 Tax=Apis florea TaxID=7463 RepID=UPI0012FF3C4B|nr:uncharacterized protein LOC100866235 [Apis florea]